MAWMEERWGILVWKRGIDRVWDEKFSFGCGVLSIYTQIISSGGGNAQGSASFPSPDFFGISNGAG